MSLPPNLRSLLQIGVAVVVVGAIIFFFFRPGEPAPLEKKGTVTFPDGTQITVEIADTPETVEHGLSNRRSLADNHGMLFVFPVVQRPIFWMKDMHFPLDILWLRDGVIVDLIGNAPPYGSMPPIKYLPEADTDMVLEMRAGSIESHGLKIGDTLDIERP